MNTADLEQRLAELDEISLRCDTEHALIEPLLALWRSNGSSRVAPVPNPVPPSPTEHICTDCDRTFVSAQGLSLHRTRLHRPTEPRNADELVRVEPTSNLLDTPPMTTVDPGLLALRCTTCEFAVPTGPIAPLVLHVQDVHHRNPTVTERQPRKSVMPAVAG